MNKKFVFAAVAAGVTIVGCGWYYIKATQRKAVELQEQLQAALQLAEESKFDECVSLLQDSIEKMQQFYGPNDPHAIHTVAILANILHRQNKLPDAERLMRQCCVGLDAALGADHEETLNYQNELMNILFTAGKTSEALVVGTKLFDLLCNKLGPNHLQCVKVGASLCSFMQAEGEIQQSVDFARIMVESCRSGSPYCASSPESLHLSLQILTQFLTEDDKIEEAIQCAQEMVAVCTANNLEADGPPQSHYTLLNLQTKVRIEDALLTARSTANYCEQLHGTQSLEHVGSLGFLARLLSQVGIFQEAFATWERVYCALEPTLGPEHHELLDTQVRTAGSQNANLHSQNKHSSCSLKWRAACCTWTGILKRSRCFNASSTCTNPSRTANYPPPI